MAPNHTLRYFSDDEEIYYDSSRKEYINGKPDEVKYSLFYTPLLGGIIGYAICKLLSVESIFNLHDDTIY